MKCFLQLLQISSKYITCQENRSHLVGRDSIIVRRLFMGMTL